MAASAQEALSAEKQDVVKAFIERVRSGNRDSVAAYTRFPIRREYPIPFVRSAAEFVARYDQIFDRTLIKKIVDSNPAIDWSAAGWRGIMFDAGKVWLDDDGTLTAITYQSGLEEKLIVSLIERDRAGLHSSLKEFASPKYVFETKTYRVRIDQMPDASYRYASWKLSKPMSDKPDLILQKGVLEFRGSGGNHDITFTNGVYRYVLEIIFLGEDNSPPARLHVYKNDNELLVQDATIVGQ